MGAEFNEYRLKATNDNDALKDVRAIIERCYYDWGHGGYTGSFAEANGVEFRKDVKPTDYATAVDWLDENCRKWGPILIVKTAEGEYIAGAWCSS